jgi:hypothetical protein
MISGVQMWLWIVWKDFGMVMEWFWYAYGLVMTWYWIKMIFGIALRSYVIYSNPFLDHTLW